MKFLIAICLIIGITHSTFSQKNKPSHYIFPEFQNGTVKMKSGVTHDAMLNYNTILQAMVISAPGSPMVLLADLGNVEAVHIQGRKFIPSDKAFYEVISDAPIPHFIHYTCKVIPVGESIGYGGISQTTNTSVASVRELAPFYQVQLPDKYKITPLSTIVVVKDGDYIELDQAKKVREFFPGKDAAIKTFLKENKISFTSAEDVKKLMLFLQ